MLADLLEHLENTNQKREQLLATSFDIKRDKLSCSSLSKPVLLRSSFLTWREMTMQKRAFGLRLNKPRA